MKHDYTPPFLSAQGCNKIRHSIKGVMRIRRKGTEREAKINYYISPSAALYSIRRYVLDFLMYAHRFCRSCSTKQVRLTTRVHGSKMYRHTREFNIGKHFHVRIQTVAELAFFRERREGRGGGEIVGKSLALKIHTDVMK